MSIKDFCQRNVVTVTTGQSVLQAANAMKDRHVGDVVVLSSETGKPIGIVTDRDIVNEVAAENIVADDLNIEDIIVHDLKVVHEEDGIFQVISAMKDYGVRRMPIVNNQGSVVGICCLDDLLELLADEIGLLSQIPRVQISFEKQKKMRTV
jgi:CBS domain-containing protein